MNSLMRVRELAHSDDPSANSEIYRELLDSLQLGKPVCLSKLYDLGYEEFELAVGAILDWRLHRYSFAPATGTTT